MYLPSCQQFTRRSRSKIISRFFFRKLFPQKATSYGSSGRSAKYSDLLSFFQVVNQNACTVISRQNACTVIFFLSSCQPKPYISGPKQCALLEGCDIKPRCFLGSIFRFGVFFEVFFPWNIEPSGTGST